MAASANILNILGLIFLSHAVYSAYEHSLLPQTTTTASSGTSFIPSFLDPKISLPADIALEALVSTIMLCVGIVLGAPELKPIQWNLWAGRLERSEEARAVTEVGVGGGNPYAALEERPGFLDVRETRRAFSEWVKDQSGKSK